MMDIYIESGILSGQRFFDMFLKCYTKNKCIVVNSHIWQDIPLFDYKTLTFVMFSSTLKVNLCYPNWCAEIFIGCNVEISCNRLKFFCYCSGGVTANRTVKGSINTTHCPWAGLALADHMQLWPNSEPGPVFSYKIRYIVGFWLVKMAISTSQKPQIYRYLYENTGEALFNLFTVVYWHFAF